VMHFLDMSNSTSSASYGLKLPKRCSGLARKHLSDRRLALSDLFRLAGPFRMIFFRNRPFQWGKIDDLIKA
jgi:hypothetical protein